MNNNYEDFASFATRRFSTLTTFSAHLKGIISHKITEYQKFYVYFSLYVYISRDFSLPLPIEMYGWPCFFQAIPTESTTVLSDNIIFLAILYYDMYFIY